MIPESRETLEVLGAFIRAARMARGINQQRAAREAKVSRQQLAILEKGGNVSILFLLKIARYLEIQNIPLDGTIELVSGQSGLNVTQLIGALDVLSTYVDDLRSFAVDAVLPPSERRTLRDAPALRDFVARHATEEKGLARLGEAMRAMGTERPPQRQPSVPHEEPAPARKRAQRRRRQ